MFDILSDFRPWLAVAIGLILFGMGWFKGYQSRREFTEEFVGSIIDDLVKQGFIKTKRQYNQESGKWEVDILKFDE